MTQLPLQFVDFALHVSVILCMGDVTLPSRLTFAGMSCAHTSLTAPSPFEAPARITNPLTLLDVDQHLFGAVLLLPGVDLPPPS